MLSRRTQIIIAGASAVVAAVAVFAYTASIKSEASFARAAALGKYGGEQTQVLVASSDIAVGQSLTEGNVAQARWLVDLLPSGDVASDASQVEGKVAQVAIKKNEPVLMERVGTGTSRISVPKGLAAVTVSSDDVLAVGGAIQAGSFVDVYVESSSGKVELMGQRIVVLETSQLAGDGKGEQVTWVTLAVTPDSVSELMTASAKGSIHFALPSSSAGKDGSK